MQVRNCLVAAAVMELTILATARAPAQTPPRKVHPELAAGRTRRRGCRGTIAMPWHGSLHPPPRNMMNPAWPERIDCGHGWVTLRNGRY